jgi:hypothetical protein
LNSSPEKRRKCFYLYNLIVIERSESAERYVNTHTP